MIFFVKVLSFLFFSGFDLKWAGQVFRNSPSQDLFEANANKLAKSQCCSKRVALLPSSVLPSGQIRTALTLFVVVVFCVRRV